MIVEVGKRYVFLFMRKAVGAKQPNETETAYGEYGKRVEVRINNAEDRGEYWYVGYTPLTALRGDLSNGRWGYTKVWKDRQKEVENYGTRILAEIEERGGRR